MLVFTPVFTRACSWSPQFLEASFLARPSCRAPVTRPVPVRQCSCRAHASERAILSVRTPSSAPASPGLPQPHRCNSCDDVTTRVCIEGGEERRGAQAAENASPEEYGTLRAGGVPRPPPRLPPDPRIKVAAQPQPATSAIGEKSSAFLFCPCSFFLCRVVWCVNACVSLVAGGVGVAWVDWSVGREDALSCCCCASVAISSVEARGRRKFNMTLLVPWQPSNGPRPGPKGHPSAVAPQPFGIPAGGARKTKCP
eukprot:scaffold13751_cov108-Isochrysis_galbana.AAC.8